MLKEKIVNKTAVIGVIGLGYVGLPLAVEKAKAGFKVIGFDIQQKRVDMVNRGENYIGDVVPEDLKTVVEKGMLTATTNYDLLKECDVVTICVPTPLDKFKQPDLSYVINTTEEIAKRLHKEMLIVLESTTYPGTTEEVVKPILEKTGLKCEEDFYLAFSPERVDPGNLIYKTKNTPKVVGGVGKKSTELAKLLYESILDAPVFVVSSPKEAEMSKILENTFRIVNIALINEMAIIARKMNINIWEVIQAASTKPFGFMPFYPGPGVGGHCIPIDPFYLTYKAREYGYHTRLIELAGEINDSMPEYVVQRVMELLNERKKCLNGAKVLLVGVAYKGDVSDTRESPALKVLEILEKYHADVVPVDPYVEEFKYKDQIRKTQKLTEQLCEWADIAVITTAHKRNVDYKMLVEKCKLIFDTKNILGMLGFKGDNIYLL
ncbi:nucleotide sugar dehydrogenase [Pseudothermotoga thermarum]|uniref:Nucleotide sugar dehydrogenase n=1 Tax=Pseudothermotoga thermarum DSM 5069 TaxID=688269 RepID=F7YWP2_9THEM|nr:nucleotide sugar dehydrogenase [Pseudothermotoga thermarum]AEH52032.1 nucleotide sugar dehydrogenase [Pseudothermotoga thermarum DSM 5069]